MKKGVRKISRVSRAHLLNVRCGRSTPQHINMVVSFLCFINLLKVLGSQRTLGKLDSYKLQRLQNLMNLINLIRRGVAHLQQPNLCVINANYVCPEAIYVND